MILGTRKVVILLAVITLQTKYTNRRCSQQVALIIVTAFIVSLCQRRKPQTIRSATIRAVLDSNVDETEIRQHCVGCIDNVHWLPISYSTVPSVHTLICTCLWRSSGSTNKNCNVSNSMFVFVKVCEDVRRYFLRWFQTSLNYNIRVLSM